MVTEEQLNAAAQQHLSGRLGEAEPVYRQFLAEQPDHAMALHMLGALCIQSGRPDEALEYLRRAIRIDPDLAETHYNIGIILQGKSNCMEAEAAYREAIDCNPDYAEAHNNLGNVLGEMGRLNDAIDSFREALRIKPDFAAAHNNLGFELVKMRQLDLAIAAYQQAIRFKPDYAQAYYNLALALKEVGLLDEALACCQKAVQLDPTMYAAHSSFLFSMHFHPACDARMIFEEHRRWNQRFAQPLKKFIQPHANDRNPERILRIGYISPDFHNHPVGRFMLPLLASHDPGKFEVCCYSDARHPDGWTASLRKYAHGWLDVTGLLDEPLAEKIRADGIDILVDLTMHSGQNRMLVFARKPAPVQVTYLAYCSTTGLDTIDYRFTDPYLDPPGSDDSFYSEKSVRLPETFWCYPAEQDCPESSPPPALTSGQVTFGCLNRFSKVSAGALQVWIQLLGAVPSSRLLLHAQEGNHRQRLWQLFQSQGIDPKRLAFAAKVPTKEYFPLHHQIDVMLDPFPCSGATTTCDSLWMGVPVVTLAGRTAAGRSGVSVLSNVGLPELIATTPQQYIQIAASLAGDLGRLSELRKALRKKMRESPLMDGPRFARNVEAAYLHMWHDWCASRNL